jgi:hypothetical protein
MGLSALHVAASGQCNSNCLGALLDGVTGLGGGAQSRAHHRGRTPPSSALNVTAAGTQWTPLHAACHAGNLVAVASLLREGASSSCLDTSGRTCFDLLCTTVDKALESSTDSAGDGWSALYSWGSTVNFALGRSTGSSSKSGPTDETPRCVTLPRDGDNAAGDSSSGAPGLWTVSAGKFHSAAVSTTGQLFTWGWGASRTGHGQPASSTSDGLAGGVVLLPRRVLGFPRQHCMAITSVACGKHHTLCCTSDGA